MKKWLRRIRGALLMGLTWAVVWMPVVVISSITLLSAASAAGSLVLARKSERRELPDATPDVAGVRVGEREAQELPGGRR